MRVGLQIPHFRPSTPENRRDWLKELAQTIEEGGFYSVWVMDHFMQLGFWLGDPKTEMMEGYTTLGYLAGESLAVFAKPDHRGTETPPFCSRNDRRLATFHHRDSRVCGS